MKGLSLLLATSVFAFLAGANAQTVPNIAVSDLTTAGYATNTGMQNGATSNWFANNGATLIVVKAAGTATTATVATQAKTMSQAGYGTAPLSDQTVSVPANSVVVAGPFPSGRWNNQYGHVAVSLTAITGVSITAVNVPQ